MTKVDLGIVSNIPIETGNTLRFDDGRQISKGTATVTVNINTEYSNGFFNNDGNIPSIGFDKSFIEKPEVFIGIDTASNILCGGCRKTTGGITGIKFCYPSALESVPITFDWVAIGRWK